MQISKNSLSYRFWQYGLAIKNPVLRLYGVGYHKDQIPDDLCRYINRLFVYFGQIVVLSTVALILAYCLIACPIDVAINMILQNTTTLTGLKTFLPYAADTTAAVIVLLGVAAFAATIVGAVFGIFYLCGLWSDHRRQKLWATGYVVPKPNVLLQYVKAKHEGICKHLTFADDTVGSKEQPAEMTRADELAITRAGEVDAIAHGQSVAEFKALDLDKEAKEE